MKKQERQGNHAYLVLVCFEQKKSLILRLFLFYLLFNIHPHSKDNHHR